MPFTRPPTASHNPVTRDPWLDNARFVLITLVVLGHLLEPLLSGHRRLADVYAFVYTFHMPAFAFLSGAVSRARADDTLFRTTAFRLLWPYLVFQGLYAAAALLPWWPDAGPGSITTPYWLLWYLLSLAAWRLLLPLFAHLRYRLALALLVALAAGAADHIGYGLSLSRTLVFFPLFLLGWAGARRWRAYCGRWSVRAAGLMMLAGTFAAVATIQPDVRWLYGSYGYAALDAGVVHGMAARLLLLLVAAGCTLAVLALVPRYHTRISGSGSRSLGAYVLQGFVIKLAIGSGALALLTPRLGHWLAPVLVVIAVLITLLLSSRAIAFVLAPLTRPRWLESALWRPDSTAADARGAGSITR